MTVESRPVTRPLPECIRAPRICFVGELEPLPRRVLLYGDSLTAGFCDSGAHFESYGLELAKTLAPEYDAEIWSCGLSGQTAELMARQMHADVITDACGRSGPGIAVLLAWTPFDLAIIMAGTNDLGLFAGDVISGNVQALHTACKEAGVPTLALSIPPNKFTMNTGSVLQSCNDVEFAVGDDVVTHSCDGCEANGRRGKVVEHRNTKVIVDFGDGEKKLLPKARLLKVGSPDTNWAKVDAGYFGKWASVNAMLSSRTSSGDTSSPDHFVDVAEFVPYLDENASQEDARWSLWDADGIHFSRKGSQALGRGLGPAVASLLRRSPQNVAEVHDG